MLLALKIVHLLSCFSLIGIVLIQAGRGSQMGATFAAGASQTLFGTVGRKDLMARITGGISVVFMVTAIFLARLPQSGGAGTSSVAESVAEQEAQAPSPPSQP